MRLHLALACLLPVLKGHFQVANAYSLTWTYTGDDFINLFDFWNDADEQDPTGTTSTPSAAFYMSQSAAQDQGLVWVNSQGHFGLSVDSTNVYSGTDLRPSVRIMSQTTIQHGLLILDAAHLPYGEGTWPAFWLLGADAAWPDAGEIDIYEGVGDSLQNTVSYHTSAGCSYQSNPDQTGILNTAVGTDCNALANNDEACGNTDPSTTSFGSGASDNGGSVYAIEWTSNFIKIWHFNRANVPSDITNDTPDPGSWGTPVTDLSSADCDIDSYFGPQNIIFNIELCGTWEGAVFSGGPEACVEFVQQNPSAFTTAYFEIASLKYYQ